MGKRLWYLLKDKKGTSYIDAMVIILVFCMCLSLLLSLMPVYTRYSTQQALTREIVRYAEQLGRTDGPVTDEFDRLCRAAGINATITWDADYISDSRKVQLRNQLAARVISDFEYGIGGFRKITITIPTKSAGRSEYYWK